MIKDTPIQEELVKWKLRQNVYFESYEDLGSVGKSYWRSFTKRYSHILRTKTGKKYDQDHANYSTFLNMLDMYAQIQEVLIENRIAMKLPEPVWMDENGAIVNDKMEGYGMKCEIQLTRPDIAFVCDEVGCNLSQEGNKFV